VNNRKPSRVEVFFTLLAIACCIGIGLLG